MKPYNEIEFNSKIENFISLKLLSESFAKAIHEEESKKIKIQELETFKAFVVTANHEFNQPLAILKGNLDLITMLHPDFAEKNENYFSKMNSSISRISDILLRLKETKKPKYTAYTQSTSMIDIGTFE